jgi:putative ABC transport system permease protein
MPPFWIASPDYKLRGSWLRAPYLYVAANSGTQPVILAGTWFDQVAKMNSWWKLDGRLGFFSRRSAVPCGLYRRAPVWLAPGSAVELRSGDRTISLTVAGIVTTGGAEDSQIFTEPRFRAESRRPFRPREPRAIERFGNATEIEAVTRTLADNLPGLDVRPVRQIAAAEGTILGRIRGLIFWTIALILDSLDARRAGIDGRSGDGAPRDVG